ncbi:hypothetical protein GO986_05365 [Deinococcus sp. HMF7620]|uniref:Uncharacterized protein n=1 Tax=Deinococcus arboris TaxID=2682977 RepID=A0A7C9HXE4_9DEIO|nr:hypothetical protein [Deinococcus arboris]MVN86188.1 hypothetical protein [Deinococcus arboris]
MSAPGVASGVRSAVLRGEPQQAWAEFTRLTAPTDSDRLWALRALMLLRREHEAHRPVQVLATAGVSGAAAELARVLLFLGRPDEALARLDAGRSDLRSALDGALWWRTRARLLAYTSSYRQGLEHAERAWEHLQDAAQDELAFYRAPLLIQVAEFQMYTGDLPRALVTLGQARAQLDPQSVTRLYLHAIELEALLSLGRWNDALVSLRRLDALPQARAQYQLRYHWARYYLAAGQLSQALREFTLVASAAYERANQDLEFWARLGTATLLAWQQDEAGCQAELLRAAELLHALKSKEHQQGFALRRAACLLRLGHPVTPELLDDLTTARDVHQAMDLPLDAAAAQLQLCEAYRRRGDEAGLQSAALTLKTLCARLRGPYLLAREWPLLPELQACLAGHLEGGDLGRPVLEVVTLGAERLLVDGQPVHVPMRRALELIAYLMQARSASLGRILADVFEEMPAAAARNQFHQVRHEIGRVVPQLHVLYDPRSREYRLETTFRLQWDVQRVRAGAEPLGGRLFLPSSGSWWAEQVNEELSRQAQAPEGH